MAQSKHCRIYVKSGDQLFDFMWANVTADGSVVMGLAFAGRSEVELLLSATIDNHRRRWSDQTHLSCFGLLQDNGSNG